MALTLDERGLLPPGVHGATLDEIEAVFGRGERRASLCASLRQYVQAVRTALPTAAIILDGSFVMTAVEEPNDLDVILELPVNWDESAELAGRPYELVDRAATRIEFQMDVFPAVIGSFEYREWLGFFEQVRQRHVERFGWPVGSLKGMVRAAI